MTRSVLLSAVAAVALCAAQAAGAQTTAPTPFYKAPLDFDMSKPELSPNAEPATPAAAITLTPDEVARVRAGHYTAALLWAGSGEWYSALSAGAQAELDALGIKVVATTDAGFDAAKQANDVDTVLALKPSAILTLVVDPTVGAASFRKARDAGTKLVFADNGADGFKAGPDYVGIVTGNHFAMGRAAADAMASALGGKGAIGFIYHDASFFVTNNRDKSFRQTIETKYPGVVIVDAKGFTEEPATQALAQAMLAQHPEIKGIYVAWDVAAEGVVEALRAAGRPDVKVITYDLGANNDLDMAKRGNTAVTVIDMPYEVGQSMARLAAYGLIGKAAPPFSTVGLGVVTRDNLRAMWESSLHKKLPASIVEALK